MIIVVLIVVVLVEIIVSVRLCRITRWIVPVTISCLGSIVPILLRVIIPCRVVLRVVTILSRISWVLWRSRYHRHLRPDLWRHICGNAYCNRACIS